MTDLWTSIRPPARGLTDSVAAQRPMGAARQTCTTYAESAARGGDQVATKWLLVNRRDGCVRVIVRGVDLVDAAALEPTGLMDRLGPTPALCGDSQG